MQSELCFLLPTLNERDNVVPQIAQLFAALPELGCVLIIDDNSQDGTVEAVRAAYASQIKQGRVRIIQRTTDLGLTPSLRDGIAAAAGSKYVGWMDCDLSMPAELIGQMLAKVEGGYDVCIGTRFLAGGGQKSWLKADQDSRVEIFLSTLLNKGLALFIGLPITDFTSGFIVCRRSVLERVELRGHHGEYFIDLMVQAHRNGARLTEIPYACGTRKYGQSKTSGSPWILARNAFRHFLAVVKVGSGYSRLRTIPDRN